MKKYIGLAVLWVLCSLACIALPEPELWNWQVADGFYGLKRKTPESLEINQISAFCDEVIRGMTIRIKDIGGVDRERFLQPYKSLKGEHKQIREENLRLRKIQLVKEDGSLEEGHLIVAIRDNTPSDLIFADQTGELMRLNSTRVQRVGLDEEQMQMLSALKIATAYCDEDVPYRAYWMPNLFRVEGEKWVLGDELIAFQRANNSGGEQREKEGSEVIVRLRKDSKTGRWIGRHISQKELQEPEKF